MKKGWIDNDNKNNTEELHCKLHCDHTVEILPWYIWSLRAASKYLSPIINKVCYELDLLQKPARAQSHCVKEQNSVTLISFVK